MVEKEVFEEQETFKCEICGFHYDDRYTATACENHCVEHGSCNDEITELSLERS